MFFLPQKRTTPKSNANQKRILRRPLTFWKKTRIKLNSERSIKFEEKYSELEKRLIVESITEDKMKKQMQKMKKGAQQLTLKEASMMPQQQIHQESKTHHSTRAPSMQTQLPMKGPQQQTLKEESMKMMQTEREARRRMSRTKQSREKPQLLQPDRHRSRRSRQSQRR